MHSIIEVRDLTKTFGSGRGVSDITIAVPEGCIFGFLGPNGAGKTTTISMMLGLTRPTKGSISIFGLDSQADSVRIRQRTGFLPGDIALDKGLTGWQQVEYLGNLRGSFDKKHVIGLAERLSCDLTRKIKHLSRGNRQKVGLVAALMHEPDLLILDEPTSGLDPLVQAEFNKLMLEHKRSGRTAFISSHVLGEVQELCDEVAFIREGKLIGQESMDSISTDLPKQLRLSGVTQEFARHIEKQKSVETVHYETGVITCTITGDIHELLGFLAKQTFGDITIVDPDLETVFLKYYEARNA
jgi:ABC-2 type transport system ATP-binding protein